MLELNPRPIPASQLESHRKAQDIRYHERFEARPGQNDLWPSKSQMARRFGVTEAMWIYWERNGVPKGPWSALLREWWSYYSDKEVWHLDLEEAPKEWVKGVAHVVGGYPVLATEVGQSVHTVRGWGSRGAPQHSGAGPLIRFLFQEMDLQPVSRLGRPDRKLTASQVRDIRRSVSEGLRTQRSLAEAYEVHESLISYIVRGKIYR